MSSAIARLVVTAFQNTAQPRVNDGILTERERMILDRLSKGLLYKEIGAELAISPETVRKHARNIYQKLHVNTRMEAVLAVFPLQLNPPLIPPPDGRSRAAASDQTGN
jgi:DNA-binding NarL/FixJ family response regulator